MRTQELDRGGMLRLRCGLALWVAAALLSPTRPALAGEALLADDFEKLDLAQLPEGWLLKGPAGPADISVADDPARGKVLRICHKGGGCPTLEIKLDIAKIRGCKVRAAVSARCPGAYTPVPEKRGWPQLMILCQKGGASSDQIAWLGPGSPDWLILAATYDVPPDADAVTVSLRIVEVAADAYFDSLRVEVEGAPVAGGAPAAPVAPGVPAAPNAPAALPTPAAPVLTPAPAGPAADAPRKSLDNDGLSFSPEMAAALLAARKPGATTRSFVVIGPGAPLRELEGKAVGKWTCVPGARELCGAVALPDSLIATLPGYVVAHKPEVVILAGEASGARKLLATERFDWEDLARICLRFGAVPVLAVPPAGTQDELRREMLESAKLADCPLLDLKTPAAVPLRTQHLLELLERHVFGRAPQAQDPKGGAKEPVTE